MNSSRSKRPHGGTDDLARVRRKGDCVHPFEADEPSGYTQWHEWAEEHAATHKHTRCPKCGLYVVCTPLEAVA